MRRDAEKNARNFHISTLSSLISWWRRGRRLLFAASCFNITRPHENGCPTLLHSHTLVSVCPLSLSSFHMPSSPLRRLKAQQDIKGAEELLWGGLQELLGAGQVRRAGIFDSK